MRKQLFMHADGGGFKPQVVANPEDIEFIIVDLFCGAGGTTTGFDMAMLDGKKIALVIACVNHDWKAIKSHWQNHPDVVHFEEDIRTLELSPLVDLCIKYRLLYPNAKLILWASLECTNFSKAKGGQPRDADSRTLADHLDRYITALDPDYVQIENVVEFMSWGPLDDNGKPVSRKSGTDWMRWRKHICSFGYYDDWKELNSADFGAYTSRNRLFGCFAKHDLPIIWPETSHAKKPKEGMFGSQQKWKPVKDVLDFDDEGQSIFNRKKPLVDASLDRIYAGLVKFVAGGKDAFVLKYNSSDGKGNHNTPSVDDPCPVIACQNRLGIVQTKFIAKYYSGKPAGKVIPVTGPAGTIKTSDGQSLISCKHMPFIVQRNTGNPDGRIISVNDPARTLTGTAGNQELVQPFIMDTNFNHVGRSVDEPALTLVASRRHPYVVKPCFLTKYHSTGVNICSVDDPASTIPTKDSLAKVQTIFLDKTYTGYRNISSIENPAGSLMPCDKHRIINCEPIILNPSHGGHCTGTDVPCVTIVARQDKAPLYVIQFECDPNVNIPIYDDDSKIMILIKQFMALYGISDIKMRMLKVPELLLIQGFPADYQLFGNQSDQKKFIGNSVHPLVPKAWAQALGGKNRELRRQAA